MAESSTLEKLALYYVDNGESPAEFTLNKRGPELRQPSKRNPKAKGDDTVKRNFQTG